MAGARKEEACDKLDGFLQIGAAGIAPLMECEGAFPKAYNDAKAFCGTGAADKPGSGSGSGSGSDILCDIAKMQVCVCICQCEWCVAFWFNK